MLGAISQPAFKIVEIWICWLEIQTTFCQGFKRCFLMSLVIEEKSRVNFIETDLSDCSTLTQFLTLTLI